MMRILVATDGSDAASRAVDFAARLASDLGGSLKIVTVLGGYDLPREQLGAFSRQEHAASDAFRSDLSEKTLAMAKQRATDLGVPDVQSESQSGDVATSIIDVARRDGADVIVLGSVDKVGSHDAAAVIQDCFLGGGLGSRVDDG